MFNTNKINQTMICPCCATEMRFVYGREDYTGYNVENSAGYNGSGSLTTKNQYICESCNLIIQIDIERSDKHFDKAGDYNICKNTITCPYCTKTFKPDFSDDQRSGRLDCTICKRQIWIKQVFTETTWHVYKNEEEWIEAK